MERRFKHRLLSLVLALVMTLTLLPMSAMATGSSTSPELDYRIVHLDCGRKYFSVDNIKSIIDTASAAGFNYLELAFGNDGLRFLLDDMSVSFTVTTQADATASYSVDEQSAEEEPAEPETPAEEPAAEVEAPAEEPAAEEETTTEEPAAEVETPAEEPAAEDETSTEEPAAEPETPAEEPAAEEETTTEEPAAEAETPAEEAAAMPTSMTTTANDGTTTYSSTQVTNAIKAANKAYYDAGDKNELTQAEMDEIIDYANSMGMSIIPLFNTPGHMNAMVTAMMSLGVITAGYNGSTNTIDVTDATAVAFTQALVQKYIDYFARKGCTVFNIGADEYANDKYSTGGMGFAQLVRAGQYDEFVTYVNELAAMVKAANMTPMAFNDGIYYNNDTTTKIDTDILVAYWTCGWWGYDVASASFLSKEGFKLVNTNGDYYWVLGKTNAQCSAEKAAGFDVNTFIGNKTISGTPAGAMFCIWCDYPDAGTPESVVEDTADVITAFGGAIYTAPVAEDVTLEHQATNITVTAPGLETVNAATKSEGTAIDGATATAAYDITLTASGADYTGAAELTFPIPTDWNLEGKTVKGYVVNENSSVTLIDGTLNEGKTTFTFTCPHFSETGIALLDADTANLTEKTINIKVGGTYTDTISGANYAGEYTTADPSIATVAVTGTDGQEATTTYTQASVNCRGLISRTNSSWQTTGYYYRANDGNYYPLYAQRTDISWDWDEFALVYTYTWGYSTTGSANSVTTIGTQKESNTSATPNIPVYSQSGTEAVPASTTVTFTAGEVGTTTVTIGNVLYNINVIAEDLTSAEDLTIEYWITNAHVEDAGGNNSLSVSAQDAYGENGVAISDLVPPNAIKSGDKYPTVYWKARRLPEGDHQTTAAGVDKTTVTAGTDITHIRYWGGYWQYSADGGSNWVNIADTDQLVAYYLQRTTVTDEIITDVVDYGNVPGDWGSLDYLGTSYVLVDYAVHYESGEVFPTSFPVAGKSLGFHCEGSSGATQYRTLGMIRAQETSEYEVYMITLTPTEDAENSRLSGFTASRNTSYSYNGTEVVAWAATQEDLDNSGLGTWTSISGNFTYSIGGEPIVPGLEIYRQHGMLVTYYIRAKVTEDSLTVHYIDRTANNNEFYNYNIAVVSGTLFNENIGLNTANWKGDLVNGSVTNSNDRTQTVSSDLSTLPEISQAYTSRNYTCVEVVRSDDGKDVYLYYTFSDSSSAVYDYGLGLMVTAADMGLSNVASFTVENASRLHYGTVTTTGDSVTYTPSTMSVSTESVQLTVTYKDGAATTHYLTVIPATTVYYEEDFLTFNGNWTTEGAANGGTQAYDTIPYGYDAAYDQDNGYSNGAARKTTIAQGSPSETAEFTFTGTGFDIYSTSAPASGLMKVQVSNASGVVKTVNVQNTGNTLLYQVPVVSIEGLTHGTYNVTVTCYGAYTDSTTPALSRGGEHVIDAVVIYNPLATEGEQYRTDKEANAVRLEVRNAIIEAQTYGNDPEGTGVLYLNTADGQGVVEDYTLVGPNNEAYLSNGHAIAFTLATSTPVQTLQIGAKSADGSAVNMSVTVNDETTAKAISTATAMNYELGLPEGNTATLYDVYITNTGSGVLSITDVKATFASDATAEFQYSEALVEALSDSTPGETGAKISTVTITTSRVRYGRNMTIEVVTDKLLVDDQSFSVKAGSRTYTVGGGSRYGLTVSEPVQNDNGTYTYTLTLKPYAYSLLKSTTFTVTLSGTTEGSASTGSDSAKVYLF